MQRLRFKSFKTFKERFMVPFCTNDEYKPYQNTLRSINMNFCSRDFYTNKPRQLSLTTCKKVIEGMAENFAYLDNLHMDFVSSAIMQEDNLKMLENIFQGKQLQLRFKGDDAHNGDVDKCANEEVLQSDNDLEESDSQESQEEGGQEDGKAVLENTTNKEYGLADSHNRAEIVGDQNTHQLVNPTSRRHVQSDDSDELDVKLGPHRSNQPIHNE